ncbi:MAG: hypothetical protein WCO86_17860, partial [Planctomycetota bacterium]
MTALQEATRMALACRVKDALSLLDMTPAISSDRVSAGILRADILLTLGRYREAKQQTDALLSSKTLTASQHCECHRLLAQVEIDFGRYESAVVHLQRSVAVASSAGDHVG